MAEALRTIVIGLALAIASLLLPVPALSQPIRTGPSWSELSAQDRQVLAPLASEWDKYDLLRKNKWLALAKRYPTLPAPEQQRIRERMERWTKLSSQERQAAREKFKGLKTLPPEQRKELSNKWIEYQSLPKEQQQAPGRSSTGQRAAPGGNAAPAGPASPPAQ